MIGLIGLARVLSKSNSVALQVVIVVFSSIIMILGYLLSRKQEEYLTTNQRDMSGLIRWAYQFKTKAAYLEQHKDWQRFENQKNMYLTSKQLNDPNYQLVLRSVDELNSDFETFLKSSDEALYMKYAKSRKIQNIETLDQSIQNIQANQANSNQMNTSVITFKENPKQKEETPKQLKNGLPKTFQVDKIQPSYKKSESDELNKNLQNNNKRVAQKIEQQTEKDNIQDSLFYKRENQEKL